MSGPTPEGPVAATARRVGIVCLAGIIGTATASAYVELDIPAEAASSSLLAYVAAQSGLIGLVLFQIAASLLVYALLCNASFRFFFVKNRRRFNATYRRDERAIGNSRLWTVLGITGGTLLAAPIQAAVLSGWGQAYWSVETHGWGYLLLSIVLLLVFTETAVYWTHRLLHVPFFFRRIHAYHHQFREPTPWAAFAFHPVDAFSQALPYHVAALLFPLDIWVYTVSMSLVMVWSVSIHDRVTLFPFRWLNYAGHHTLHHIHNRYNLGQYFTFWDRIGGTYRCPSTLPDRYAAGRPS